LLFPLFSFSFLPGPLYSFFHPSDIGRYSPSHGKGGGGVLSIYLHLCTTGNKIGIQEFSEKHFLTPPIFVKFPT
jgi:hypothetical protein